jgi:23S rRNA (adenine2503-C2)-methyltransferase
MNTHWPKIRRIESSDANVAKFVFENGTAVAEAVLYKYPTYEERTVICCSTQSGCPVGCRFCGAGDKFVRSLTSDEIFEQPKYLLEQTGIDASKIQKLQIMFMSMGEPLLNWVNLKPAIYRLYANIPTLVYLLARQPRKNILLLWS